jgi:transposase
VTNEDKADDCRAHDRAEAISRARRLLAEGHSKRQVARHLGVADATLRTGLRKRKEGT